MRILVALILFPFVAHTQMNTDSVVVITTEGHTIRFTQPVVYVLAGNDDSIVTRNSSTRKRGLLPQSTFSLSNHNHAGIYQPAGTYATGTGSATGTNTGDNATNSQYSGLAASKLSIPVAGQGTGGTVTQATNKTTGVTLNKICGQITMNNAALAAAAEVSFVVTNSTVASTDVVIINVQSVGTAGSYFVTVGAVSNGSFAITVGNASAGSLSQAVVLNFMVLKSVAN